MDLGHRVRDLRNAQHLSQIELAARARVARNTLNRIENGHLMPTAPVIERLAEALSVAPGALFGEPAVPLDEAPPVRGQQLAPEAMPGTAGELIEVRIGEDKSGTHVEVIRTPFLDLFRKVRRGLLSPEEAAERAEEATKRALRSVS